MGIIEHLQRLISYSPLPWFVKDTENGRYHEVTDSDGDYIIRWGENDSYDDIVECPPEFWRSVSFIVNSTFKAFAFKTKKPTEPGYYWIRRGKNVGIAKIIKNDSGKLILLQPGNKWKFPIDDCLNTLEYAGPLPFPGEGGI